VWNYFSGSEYTASLVWHHAKVRRPVFNYGVMVQRSDFTNFAKFYSNATKNNVADMTVAFLPRQYVFTFSSHDSNSANQSDDFVPQYYYYAVA